MRLAYFSVICTATLLGVLYAQSPPLSPSYTLRARGSVTGANQSNILSLVVDNDANRRLYQSRSFSFSPGPFVSVITLVSGVDNVAFVTTNSQCVREDPGSMRNILDIADPWGSFTLVSTVGSVSTYTSGTNATLILTNGVPTSLTTNATSNGQTTQTVLTIDSFTNSTPPFFIFRLDSRCVAEGFTCGSCFNPVMGIPLSPSFSLSGTATATPGNQAIVFDPYIVYNDANRELIRIEYAFSISGEQSNINILGSGMNDVAFTTTNNQCINSSIQSISSILNTADPWSSYTLVSTVGDVKTYTTGATTLVTTNGVPTTFTYFGGVNGLIAQTVLTIDSFTNSTPPFDVFQLDPACGAEGFTCGSCFNPVMGIPLSPSFSLRGTATATPGNQAIVFDPYIVYNDANRELIRIEYAFSISGEQSNINILGSGMNDVAFTTTNNQCINSSIQSISSILNTADPWSSYTLVSTVGDVKTYTTGATTLVTTNGVPTTFTYFGGVNGLTTQTVLTIDSFTNSTPPFDVFQLDSACGAEGFTCGSCYSSAIGIPLSPSFSLRGTATATPGNQAIVFDPYMVYNDANRELIRIEYAFSISGEQSNINILGSGMNDVAFTTTNNQCINSSIQSISSILNTADPWSSYTLVSTVGDVKTYTTGATTLVTTNGVPTTFTYFGGVNGLIAQTVLTIDSYTNSTPPFDVFQLDPACGAEGFTCGSCYSSAIGIASNLVCIIAALVVLSILSIA